MSRQRGRKKELAGEESTSKYLQKLSAGEEIRMLQSKSGVELVEELKKFLKGELQTLSSDLKDVKQDLRTLNFKFSKMEGVWCKSLTKLKRKLEYLN